MQDKFRIGRYWLDHVPGSDAFYAFCYDAGTRKVRRRSLKTSDAEEAKIRLAAIVLAEGEAKASEPDKVNLVTVLHRDLVDFSDRRPNRYVCRRAADLALEFYGGTAKVDELTKAKQRAFIAFLHQRGYAVGYIARIQGAISAALNRAADDEDGLLLRAPKLIYSTAKIAEILDVAEPMPDNWHPTLEQIAAFCDHATTQEVLRLAVLTLAFAGRPEAVAELEDGQFDPRHGLLSFNKDGRRQTKKHRPTVPVPQRLRACLEEHLAGRHTATETKPIVMLRTPWTHTLEAAGLPAKFRPKSLRHFMATEMRKRGVPREQREEWMGHRRRSTNDRYGHFAPDYLNAARDCADAVLGELELLAKLPIYRQIALKPKLQRIDPIKQSDAPTIVLSKKQGREVA